MKIIEAIEEIENNLPDVDAWDIKETDSPRFTSLKEVLVESSKTLNDTTQSIYAYRKAVPELDLSVNPLTYLLNHLDSKYRKPDDPMPPTDYMQYALKNFLFNVLCEYETSAYELIGKVDLVPLEKESPSLRIVH